MWPGRIWRLAKRGGDKAGGNKDAGDKESAQMNRRSFFQSALAAGSAAGIGTVPPARAALPKMKITRVRAYSPPTLNTLFNQSDMVVTVETDGGITGVGEGGAKDTLEQCAGRLIGQDPQY